MLRMSISKLKIMTVVALLALTIIAVPNILKLYTLYAHAQIQSGNSNYYDKIFCGDPELSKMFSCVVENVDVSQIGEFVCEYPQNSFFKEYLAIGLLSQDRFETQPKFSSQICDELIALHPDNAYFHYFKAAILLNSGESFVRDAIEEVEFANSMPFYEPSILKYQDRIIDESSYVSWTVKKTFETKAYSQYLWLILPIARGVDACDKLRMANALDGLLHRSKVAHKLMPPLDYASFNMILSQIKYQESGGDISVATDFCWSSEIVNQAKNEINRYYKDINLFTVQLLSLFILSVGFACSAVATIIPWLCKKFYYKGRYFPLGFVRWLICVLAMIIILFAFAGIAIDSALSRDFNIADFDYGIFLCACAMIGLAVFFVLGKIVSPKKVCWFGFWQKGVSLVCVAIFFSYTCFTLFKNEDRSDSILFIGAFFLICAVVWAIAAFFWPLLRRVNFKIISGSYIFQFVVLTILTSGLYIIFCKSDILIPLLMLAYLLCTVVLITAVPRSANFILVNHFVFLFSRKTRMKLHQARFVRVFGVLFFIFWVCLSVMLNITNVDVLVKESPAISTEKLLAQIGEPAQVYQERLSEMDEILSCDVINDSTARKIEKVLGLLSYEDIEATLVKIVDKDIDDVNFSTDYSINSDDKLVLFLMPRTNQERVSIYVSFLKEPDSDGALVKRAECGDKTAAKKLWGVYERVCSGEIPLNTDGYSYNRDRRFNILKLLARNGESRRVGEVLTGFMEDSEESTRTDFSYDLMFVLSSMDASKAEPLFAQYSKRMNYWISEDGELNGDLDVSNMSLADEDTATEILTRIFNREIIGKQYDWETAFKFSSNRLLGGDLEKIEVVVNASILNTIYEKFTDKSLGMFVELLDRADENMLPFVVSQLSRLGYDWSEEEIEEYSKSENDYVRLEMLLAKNTQNSKPLTALDVSRVLVNVQGK